jgi:hypothetical protein
MDKRLQDAINLFKEVDSTFEVTSELDSLEKLRYAFMKHLTEPKTERKTDEERNGL